MMSKTKKKGTRSGFTTGACSAAAARAATLALINRELPAGVDIDLPNGDTVRFAVNDGMLGANSASAAIVKDAGDDPDCTHGAHLTAEVQLLSGQAGVFELAGGDGVGTVTQPGLGLEVDAPAINPVPRQNIEANVQAVAASLLTEHGLRVTISVPGGQAMARKTHNARLGIIGGISILGTTGVVKAYSTAAFRASVVQGIEVNAAQGCKTVVLTTGGRTEKFVMAEFPDLPNSAFVQMGDFLRYALDTAVSTQTPQVIIGGMIGKLTKMAQGETITHANRSEVNTGLLADIARECGAPADLCEDIRNNETARYAGDRMIEWGQGELFHRRLAERVINTLSGRYPQQFEITVKVCDFSGNKITEVSGNQALTPSEEHV